jgi:hypothetical protein
MTPEDGKMAKASDVKSERQAISERLNHDKPADSAHLAVFTGDVDAAIQEIMDATGMTSNAVVAEALRRMHEQEVE